MNKEFLAKRLTKFKNFEEIADYILAEIEKAKKEAYTDVLNKYRNDKLINWQEYIKEKIK